MATNDDDWPHPPGTVDGDRYRGKGRDLWAPINHGQRVADLRTLADLSPQVLATASGLSVSELLAIEAGLMTLSQPTALRLSAALGVQYVDLWIDA